MNSDENRFRPRLLGGSAGNFKGINSSTNRRTTFGQSELPLHLPFPGLRGQGRGWAKNGECELPGVEERGLYRMRLGLHSRNFGQEQNENTRAAVSRHEARACQTGDVDACGTRNSGRVGG